MIIDDKIKYISTVYYEKNFEPFKIKIENNTVYILISENKTRFMSLNDFIEEYYVSGLKFFIQKINKSKMVKEFFVDDESHEYHNIAGYVLENFSVIELRIFEIKFGIIETRIDCLDYISSESGIKKNKLEKMEKEIINKIKNYYESQG